MRWRLVAGVCLAWVVAGTLWGAQTSLGSTLQGREAIALAAAVRTAMIQAIAWIPVTLAVIALTIRFPLTRGKWKRNIPVHFVGAIVLAFAANVLIVLGFWTLSGRFNGLEALAKAGALWATVNFHFALLIYAAILGITQTVQAYRETRARELQLARVEGQLARARLEALNAQIRPHFLFNTLHTIGQLWRSGRSDEADAVLDGLGALFHKVQSHTERIEIPLREEMEFVRGYLAIEEARFPDRLKPTIRASEDALDHNVPPLILQPIVENAVRHGISASSAAGVLEVTAAVVGSRLIMTVSDDGPGMSATTAAPGTGTGLRNTRERIRQLYGESALLSIAESGEGTTVTIDIPVNRARQRSSNGVHG